MLKFQNVIKKYDDKVVLDGVSFDIDSGEFVFLVGPTGCGKTTAFRLLIKEEDLTDGEIVIDDYSIKTLKGNLVPELRRQIGVVFQDYKLIPNRNLRENIAYAMIAMNKSDEEIAEMVNYLLDLVGLKDREHAFPEQLSGGEKQKVAIARAMANSPLILIADEPTGNLDPVATWEVVDILKKINEKGTTVIMSTHEVQIVNLLNKRVIELKDGKVVKDGTSKEYIHSITEEQKDIKSDIANAKKEEKVKEVEEQEKIDMKNIKKWKEWFNKESLAKEHTPRERHIEVEIPKKEEEKKVVEEKLEELVKEVPEIKKVEPEEKVEKEEPLIEEKKTPKVSLLQKLKEKLKKEEDKKEVVEKKIKVSLKGKTKTEVSGSNIDILDIPLKIKSALKAEGFDSIDKLKNASEHEISDIDGIGSKGYEKIKKALKY
jgi:cell division transport system ATP-binding protein